MEPLEAHLNSLWAAEILEIHTNFSKCELEFVLVTLDNGISNHHNILISGIEMFCFTDDSRSTKPEKSVFMELTTIGICQENTSVVIDYSENITKEHYHPNLMIEISDTVLLISAKQIQIDALNFDLKRNFHK